MPRPRFGREIVAAKEGKNSMFKQLSEQSTSYYD